MSDDHKRSWREIDQMRDAGRRSDHDRPRHPAQQRRSAAATRSYLAELDKLFTTTGMSPAAEALARRMREAHGTPELAPACRELREAFGMPRDIELLSIVLDCGEKGLVVEALETLLAIVEQTDVKPGKGVQSQLRVLAQDFDNHIAEAAEDILARLH